MKVLPINNSETAYKGSKIPHFAKLINKTKQENIEVLELANTFKKFEKDFRTTMQTFIYMVKNIG